MSYEVVAPPPSSPRLPGLPPLRRSLGHGPLVGATVRARNAPAPPGSDRFLYIVRAGSEARDITDIENEMTHGRCRRSGMALQGGAWSRMLLGPRFGRGSSRRQVHELTYRRPACTCIPCLLAAVPQIAATGSSSTLAVSSSSFALTASPNPSNPTHSVRNLSNFRMERAPGDDEPLLSLRAPLPTSPVSSVRRRDSSPMSSPGSFTKSSSYAPDKRYADCSIFEGAAADASSVSSRSAGEDPDDGRGEEGAGVHGSGVKRYSAGGKGPLELEAREVLRVASAFPSAGFSSSRPPFSFALRSQHTRSTSMPVGFHCKRPTSLSAALSVRLKIGGGGRTRSVLENGRRARAGPVERMPLPTVGEFESSSACKSVKKGELLIGEVSRLYARGAARFRFDDAIRNLFITGSAYSGGTRVAALHSKVLGLALRAYNTGRCRQRVRNVYLTGSVVDMDLEIGVVKLMGNRPTVRNNHEEGAEALLYAAQTITVYTGNICIEGEDGSREDTGIPFYVGFGIEEGCAAIFGDCKPMGVPRKLGINECLLHLHQEEHEDLVVQCR